LCKFAASRHRHPHGPNPWASSAQRVRNAAKKRANRTGDDT